MELAAGAGDGRRPRDGAGLRRRLAAAPGLNLGVTGHGRYRDASGHRWESDLRVSTHFGLVGLRRASSRPPRGAQPASREIRRYRDGGDG